MLLPVLVVIFLKESSTVFVINQVIAYLAGDIGTACGKVSLMSLLFFAWEDDNVSKTRHDLQ